MAQGTRFCGRYFNPRTPCGVRQIDGTDMPEEEKFQSTHPLRGATTNVAIQAAMTNLFQSTHPLRGAT